VCKILGFLFVLQCLLLNNSPLRADEPVQLVVIPKSAPVPSLKYHLVPPLQDQTPGNAATLYYRCFSVFAEASPYYVKSFRGEWLKDEKGEEYLQRDRWLKAPLKDLPQKDVEDQLRLFSFILKEARLACRKRDCDWELQGRVNITTLLPELQAFRTVGAMLVLQARLEMARGHLDAALDPIQTTMAIAGHLSRGPTIIHTLVGAALARLALEQVGDLVQLPEAPNLYWALTELPAPFGNIDPALQEEKFLVERTFPTVAELKKGPVNEKTMAALQREIEAFKTSLDIRGGPTEAIDLITQGVNAEAKKNLVAAGYATEAVEKMPKLQIAILDSVHRYETAHEELTKWRLVPLHQVGEHYQESLPAYKEACGRLDFFLFHTVLEKVSILDGFMKAWKALVRIDQRIALLRCLEAIRLHAAEHGGQPPETLAAIKVVPIPLDPMTGQPFGYIVKGKEITLQAAAAEKDAKSSLIYKIQLK
jgi:hypothetical protein